MCARRRFRGLLLVCMAWPCGAWPVQAALAARPEAGRHLAQLCVATAASAPPSCGPAQADLRANGALQLRIDDIVYHLRLHSSQVDVLVMHQAVEIAGFTAPYEWVGSTLQFTDDEHHSRYEVRFPPSSKP